MKDPREPFTRLSIEEAKEKLESGDAVMVDVRDPHEYVEVHAKGVRLIPVNTVMNELKQIREFADDKKEVLFICKMGGRSALAAEYATAAGPRRAGAVQRRGRHGRVGGGGVPDGGLAESRQATHLIPVQTLCLALICAIMILAWCVHAPSHSHHKGYLSAA